MENVADVIDLRQVGSTFNLHKEVFGWLQKNIGRRTRLGKDIHEEIYFKWDVDTTYKDQKVRIVFQFNDRFKNKASEFKLRFG